MPGLPSKVKATLEKECIKAAKKVGKALDKVGGDKIEKALVKGVCSEVPKLDKTATKMFADYMKKEFGSKGGDVPSPDGKAPPVKFRKPGSGVPGISIPLHEIVLNKELETKGKFSLRVWADPKDFKNGDKGAMIYFDVVKW